MPLRRFDWRMQIVIRYSVRLTSFSNYLMRLLCLCLVLSFDSFSFRHFNCTDGKSYFLSNSKTNVRVDLRLTRNGWNLCRSCRRAEYVKNGSWLNDRKYTPAIFFPDRFFKISRRSFIEGDHLGGQMVSRQAKGLVSTNDGRRHTFYSKEEKKSQTGRWTELE